MSRMTPGRATPIMLAMTSPVVTEIVTRLEAVEHDDFLDGLEEADPPLPGPMLRFPVRGHYGCDAPAGDVRLLTAPCRALPPPLPRHGRTGTASQGRPGPIGAGGRR